MFPEPRAVTMGETRTIDSSFPRIRIDRTTVRISGTAALETCDRDGDRDRQWQCLVPEVNRSTPAA
jgi:hypothetical protein